ncbi:30S ribosomal protein S27e [archaeon CG10_big_fil_rev_8_21_14_0_10_43_11]|nr:MAG: 30S ribosomal protein S27e [archaeon CG10_big_fil_rev_8_21_14_0_10_43_11]
MKDVIKNPSSQFVKVRCNSCKNEQVIFNKASTKSITCLVCGEELAQSTGGKTNILARVLEVLG